MLYYLDLLMVISSVPAFMLISDGYRVGNPKKGINLFFIFVFFSGVMVLLLYWVKLRFVFAIPVILLLLAVVFRKSNKS